MNGPDPHHWTINSCFGASCSVWVHLAMFHYHETRCKTCWTGAINAEVHAMMSQQNFFATNTPNPPHWTINSYLRASHSVWMHLAMFHYYTKLGGKQVELVQLMQKFVPWSCIRIFRNERTQSTPLDPKLMFWCVSWCLGAFGNVSLLHKTRCKTGWTGAINAKVLAMKSHQNFSQRTHPIHPIGP